MAISNNSISLLVVSVYLATTIILAKEKVYFVDFERANASFWSRSCFAFMNVSVCRSSRREPRHCLNIHFETVVALANDVHIDIYFHQFLNNKYQPSFVEMHYRLCDLIHKDKYIGPIVAKQVSINTCPMPKDVYHRENISISDMPLLATFPFQKGRLYTNVTQVQGHPKESRIDRILILQIDIDVVIKAKWR